MWENDIEFRAIDKIQRNPPSWLLLGEDPYAVVIVMGVLSVCTFDICTTEE